MPRGKINREKILASLAAECPHCNARIEPSEQVRMDFERMKCPKCKETFVPHIR